MTRRLAAILAADVADYSRLMHEDEQATHARFTEIMNVAVVPALASHGGRAVKSTGDGFLAEFPSAVEAVQCALQFQTAIGRITANDADERRLNFRVGIHIGEVIVEEHDIYGDGVNIAARLEALADRGGIMVSEAVHENVRGRLPCEFEDLGAQQVKNIARPVHLFRALANGKPPPKAPAGPPLRKKTSIVVLPFQNLSGDPEQDYFADGIVEDITTALSRFRSLFVIARQSAFAYKGRAVDIRQVGRELGARYVVEGSLRKIGSRLRVTGQTIQTDTGANIWADRYDRDLSDVFALQDEVTTSIVSALVPIIQRAEIEHARRKPTGSSLDAHDLYLCALAAHANLTRIGNRTARELLDRALALDPHFSPALVLDASCQALAVANGWLPAQCLIRALHHARLAVQTDPEDAEALAALAVRLAGIAGDAEESLGLTDRALAANPHSASVLRKCGLARLHAGQTEAAIELFERSLRLSPTDPPAYAAWAGMALALLALGRDAEAVAAARRAVQFNPVSCDALRVLTASLALADRLHEAQATLGRLLELDPICSIQTVRLGEALHQKGGNRLLDGLRYAGLVLGGASFGEDNEEGTILLKPRHREPRRTLLVTRPGEPDREILIAAIPLVLGRAPESSIVLNDPKVSRAHCRIMVSDNEVTAIDLQSTNGTLIDRRPIAGVVRLAPGVVLEIGPYQVRYQHQDPQDDDRTALSTAINNDPVNDPASS